MNTPLHLTFKGLASSPALEEKIRAKADKLDHFHDRITSCRVVVEAANARDNLGRVLTVRVDVTVPGAELVASREAGTDADVHVAVRDAFDAVIRQLEDHVRKHRTATRHH